MIPGTRLTTKRIRIRGTTSHQVVTAMTGCDFAPDRVDSEVFLWWRHQPNVSRVASYHGSGALPPGYYFLLSHVDATWALSGRVNFASGHPTHALVCTIYPAPRRRVRRDLIRLSAADHHRSQRFIRQGDRRTRNEARRSAKLAGVRTRSPARPLGMCPGPVRLTKRPCARTDPAPSPHHNSCARCHI
jgi:hypothetical protein